MSPRKILVAAVEGASEVDGLDRYDILFRMLEPHELAAAMGFTGEGRTYRFAGTKTDQIKQIGNAVSVAMMAAETRAIMEDDASVWPGADLPLVLTA